MDHDNFRSDESIPEKTLTVDDIGAIHGDNLLNQHSIIERFDNLNCAMIMFHKLSHREDVVIAKLFQRITDNGESIIEDMIPDALLCSSRIETRMSECLQDKVSFLEQELSIMQEFLKKHNAEKAYADYRTMAITDRERM